MVVTCSVGARPMRPVSWDRYAARTPASIRAPADGATGPSPKTANANPAPSATVTVSLSERGSRPKPASSAAPEKPGCRHAAGCAPAPSASTASSSLPVVIASRPQGRANKYANIYRNTRL